MEPFYRTSFAKHLHNVVVNGFWGRDLDADDHEFLEYVRKSGSANGSLASSDTVLLEELEFWHLPYTVAPGVARSVGRRPRPVETAEQRSTQKIKQNTWHAQRVIREHEKAIAAIELERENREWREANRNRELREMLSDAAWEAAAPWKLNEQQWAAKQAEIEKRREQAARRSRDQAQAKAQKLQQQEYEQYKQQEQERKRSEQIIAEARKTVARTVREVNEAPLSQYPTANSLKQAIQTLLKSTPGHVWTQHAIMRSLGFHDAKLMSECLAELMHTGQARLRTADKRYFPENWFT